MPKLNLEVMISKGDLKFNCCESALIIMDREISPFLDSTRTL